MPPLLDHFATAQSVLKAYPNGALDKTVIITGGNTGLGLETAKVLARGGARVTIGCRSVEKGLKAVQAINEKELSSKNNSINVKQLDLSDFHSIKAFAEGFIKSGRPLNILINNAGVMASPFGMTKDGYEIQMGVNHLGHFLLTQLLLPVLVKSGNKNYSSRVINVSSVAHWLFGPSTVDVVPVLLNRLKQMVLVPTSSSGTYNPWKAYGESKFANVLFTKELNRRMAEGNQPVISVSLHPGVILGTDLKRHFSIVSLIQVTFDILYLIFVGKGWSFLIASIHEFPPKSIPQGAATQVYCATASESEIIPGQYYCDCKMENQVYVTPHISNQALLSLFWEESLNCVKSHL